MASSVTDSRTFGKFPNTSRNVNGTLIYDVPSVRSIPAPVDSRTVIPVDSRVQSIIPQNSRT